jgi:hypothetical protein
MGKDEMERRAREGKEGDDGHTARVRTWSRTLADSFVGLGPPRDASRLNPTA